MSHSKPPSLRQQHIGWWLQQAARDFNARALRGLRAAGHEHLSASHLNLLPYLDVEGTRINTLAQRANMTKQAASQLINELEKQGYVTRRPDPEDGRAVLVMFTAQGQSFLADAAKLKQQIGAEYRELLGNENFDRLEIMLKALVSPD